MKQRRHQMMFSKIAVAATIFIAVNTSAHAQEIQTIADAQAAISAVELLCSTGSEECAVELQALIDTLAASSLPPAAMIEEITNAAERVIAALPSSMSGSIVLATLTVVSEKSAAVVANIVKAATASGDPEVIAAGQAAAVASVASLDASRTAKAAERPELAAQIAVINEAALEVVKATLAPETILVAASPT